MLYNVIKGGGWSTISYEFSYVNTIPVFQRN